MYAYVIEFNDGTVKVGKTAQPQNRMTRHQNDASRFGVSIRNTWLSGDPIEGDQIEHRLIAFCTIRGTARPGASEYFTGVSFIDCVAFAVAHVPMEPTDVAAVPGPRVPEATVFSDETDRSVLALLSQGTSSSVEIMSRVNKSRATVYRSLQRLEQSGRVIRLGNNRWSAR